jgi:hypothetical protein
MKSTGVFSIMTPRGPWLWVGALNDRDHLSGHRAAAALTISPDQGVHINLAAVPLGSVVLGWWPGHRTCHSGPGPYRHRPWCLWRYAPDLRVETAPPRATPPLPRVRARRR